MDGTLEELDMGGSSDTPAMTASAPDIPSVEPTPTEDLPTTIAENAAEDAT